MADTTSLVPVERIEAIIYVLRGEKVIPYAFTEQGVAMLSGVLRSERAVQVNVEIMRAFVRLRRMAATREDLARKIEALEEKYDSKFSVVFDALRELMAAPEPSDRQIGFKDAS